MLGLGADSTAHQCCIDIQQELKSVNIAEGVTLQVKLGVGVGHIAILHVGGRYGRLEYLAAGAPLVQAYHAEHNAAAGDIIISHESTSAVLVCQRRRQRLTGLPRACACVRALLQRGRW